MFFKTGDYYHTLYSIYALQLMLKAIAKSRATPPGAGSSIHSFGVTAAPPDVRRGLRLAVTWASIPGYAPGCGLVDSFFGVTAAPPDVRRGLRRVLNKEDRTCAAKAKRLVTQRSRAATNDDAHSVMKSVPKRGSVESNDSMACQGSKVLNALG